MFDVRREYADGILFALALATIPIAICDSPLLSGTDQVLLAATSWMVYGAFLVNFVVVLLDRQAHGAVREVVWDVPLIVGQPLLAFFAGGGSGSIIAVLRLVAVMARGLSRTGAVRLLWRGIVQRPLRTVVAAIPLLLLLWSSIVLRAEISTEGPGRVHSIGDALWWGVVTMATVGYGDISPITPLGRVAAVGAMVTGIAAFSVVTAKLAELLLAARDEIARSEVEAAGHQVLLGWSPRIVTLVRQLMIANESAPHAHIVILCDKPRREAEAELRKHIPELRSSKTKVSCRTGSPQEPTDLATVSPHTARAVVIAHGGGQTTDTVTVLLALLTSGFAPPPDAPVIAEIADPDTALSVRAAFGGRVMVIDPGDLIARITAQSCRQPGIGLAYEELLDFEGSELYLVDEPAVTDRRFGAILRSFPGCIPLGCVDAANHVTLCPSMEHTIGADERLVLLAPDDSMIRFEESRSVAAAEVSSDVEAVVRTEEVLVIGWNPLAETMMRELARYLPSGSRIRLLPYGQSPPNAVTVASDLDVAVVESNNVKGHAKVLDDLVDESDHVIVLTDWTLEPRDADARSLLATLRVRNRIGSRATTLVTELLDEGNVELGRRAGVAEFVVSDKLTSLLMAQLAETPALIAVFDRLLDPDDADFAALPAADFAPPGTTISFDAVIERARQLGHIAVGYRQNLLASRHEDNFGVVINPHGSTIVVFGADDRVLVLTRPAIPRGLAG